MHEPTCPDAPPSSTRGEQGFSVLEVLIAAFVLLYVAIGVLPMFTQSMANNVQGQQLTQAIHRAKSEMEEIIQLDFNDPSVLALAATESEKVFEEYWDQPNYRWVAVPTSGVVPSDSLYLRTTRIRQYNLDELRQTADTATWSALPGSASPNEVHLKQIEVEVKAGPAQGTASLLGSPARQLTLRTFKSF